MEGFRFVANLKPYTFDRGRGNRRFDAYLLSIDYFRSLRDLAKLVVDEGRVLCADNGNFDLLGRLTRQFEAEAKSIDANRVLEERSLRRYARPGDLSTPLRRRFETLARNVRSAARDVFDDDHVRSVVQMQQAMNATYAIGMEDLTFGVLTALGLEAEYHGLPLGFYEETTDRTIALCRDTQDGRFGPCDALVFAGQQAYDLDSARAAGRAAGRANAAGIATGLAGALQDRGYVDFRVEDGRVIDLGKRVPRPYVRIAEILVGLHEGTSKRRAAGRVSTRSGSAPRSCCR